MGHGLVNATATTGNATHRSDTSVVALPIDGSIVRRIMRQRVTAMIASEIVVDIEHVGQQ